MSYAHLGKTRTTYRVVVTRENTDWIAEAPDVPGAQTWARNLVVLERGIREAIAAVLDLDESQVDGIDIRLEFENDSEAMRRAAVVRALRDQISQLEQLVAEQSRPLAADLATEGYSVRDVSVLLGISPGRVSQLASEPPAMPDHDGAHVFLFFDSGASLVVPAPPAHEDEAAKRGWGEEWARIIRSDVHEANVIHFSDGQGSVIYTHGPSDSISTHGPSDTISIHGSDLGPRSLYGKAAGPTKRA